jgi:serine/threonine-protein kinase RsbW
VSSTKEKSLLVHATTENISQVRNFVALQAGECGFSVEETDEIRLAVDEAYTNIIKHAYQFDETQLVTIKVICDGDGFQIVISDHGRRYDPETYQEPNIEERIKLRKRGGVGVYLIQKLMDRVEYRQNGSLNEIVMTKKI